MKKKLLKKFLLYVFWAIVCYVVLRPIWVVMVGSMDCLHRYSLGLFVPEHFTLQGYVNVFTRISVLKILGVSLGTAFIGSFIRLVLTIFGAFVLAEKELPGRTFMGYFLLFPLIFDGGMIPRYLVVQKLKLLNTIWAVILPSAVNIFMVFWLKGKFEEFSSSLSEAARMDGCSRWAAYWRIVIPACRPYLYVVFLNSFINYWNDYVSPKMYIRKGVCFFGQGLENSYDLLMLGGCFGTGYEWTEYYALEVVGIAVPIITFLCFQKYLTAEPLFGAVKE